MNICVDAGHNSIKAGTKHNTILMPSVTSNHVIDLDMSEIEGDMKGEYNPIDYMRVKFDGQEFSLGNLAREQSDLCIQNVNHEDLVSHETKVLSLSAAAYLSKSDHINLIYNLPITHYHEYRSKIKEMFDYKTNPVVVDIYDYRTQKYNTKAFYIRNIEIQPQGFYSLMSVLLDNRGNIREDKKGIIPSLKVVVDIGYYSTDILILNGMKPIKKIPQVPIPGISEAHKIIAKELYNKFNIRKELHEIDAHTRSKEIYVGGKCYSLSNLINSAYQSVSTKIISEINNLIPFWPEVSYWFVTGGGAEILFDNLQMQYKNAEKIDNSQFANCRGGLKWARRKYEQSKIYKAKR